MIYNQQITEGTSATRLITQGEYAVTDEAGMMISTLLGSCVACCLWDETAGVGGMNHLLLAGDLGTATQGYDLAGVADMECLINDIVKLGGRRSKLQAKIFGGAQMVEGLSKIGEKNAQFVFDYLAQEGIPCLNASVGGTAARAVRFWPSTGRVSMRLVAPEAEEVPVVATRKAQAGNDLELF